MDEKELFEAYREHTSVTAASLARVKSGVDRRLRRRSRSPFLIAAVAVAAAVIISLAIRPAPHTTVWEGDLKTVQGEWNQAQFSSAVSVMYTGSGEAVRIGNRVDIDWTSGVLRAEVIPEQRAKVTIRTQEAEITVIGTQFTVERDVRGTSVEVERGHVQVHCANADVHELHPTQRVSCRPITASGLLALARQLDDTKTSTESELLEIVESGLSLSTSDAVRIELDTMHIGLLARAGRLGEALDSAAQALADGMGHREVEIRRLASDLASAAGDCEAVVDHLSSLDAELLDATNLVAFADCAAASDPEAAREALRRALELDPDHTAQIEARLRALESVAPR